MDKREANRLIGLSIASLGRADRAPSDGQATMWSGLMPDVSFEDAMIALREHYRESQFPITPADIIARVGAMRSKRWEEWERSPGGGHHAIPAAPLPADDIAGQQRYLRAFNKAIGDGAGNTQVADRIACSAIGVERPLLEEKERVIPLEKFGKEVPKR